MSCFFVGIDWAARRHELCVVEQAGAIVLRFGFAHSERGIGEALARLAALGRAGELEVAIERPSGLLVERLLEAGHPVVPVHPNAFAAARARWGAAGAKSDPGDAFKLADYLRTDGHRLRRPRPTDAPTRELQALSRLRHDHLEAKVAQPTSSPPCSSTTGLERRRSSPASTRRSPSTSSTATRHPRARPGWARPGWPPSCADTATADADPRPNCSPACGAAPRPVDVLDPDILAELVRAQALLRTLLETIADLDRARALAAGVSQHAKARTLAPLPRIGEINLAQIVAEAGPMIERVDTAEQAAAELGAAPVTRASGQQRQVCSATLATARRAKRSPPSPTTPATPPPGPPTSTNERERAAAATHTPSASSHAPGCA